MIYQIAVLLLVLIRLSIAQEHFSELIETYENELRQILENVHHHSFEDYYENNDLAPSYKPMIQKKILKGSKTYDFIIVGSGAAGGVIANRLSANPKWKVLLLEAEEEASILTDIPIVAPTFQLTNTYNWGYLMEKQENFGLAMKNQRIPWPRGKCLGGTSVINYMIYTRGNPRDFDRWAEKGNPGWSYEEVLPYYLKSERASNLSYPDPYFHNTDGNLCVEDSFQSPLVRTFVDAGNELGYPTVDYNSPEQIGFSTVQANTCTGKRSSVTHAFLDPVRDRRNLEILTSSYVTRALIDQKTRRAYGVEYVRNKKTYAALASREVILSAGAFHSPKILMLSGIGPRHHLKELGINVIEDLPVGENLQDHIAFIGLNFLINASLSYSAENTITLKPILDYLYNGTNRLSSLGAVEGLGYIKTEVSEEEGDIPDIELIFSGGSFSSDYGIINKRTINVRDDFYYKYWLPLEKTNTWTVFLMLAHPKSRGRMLLNSKNPFDSPKFYGNYLTDPERLDIRTLISAVRFTLRLSETEAFQKYGSKLSDIRVPGCETHPDNSDEYWECAIRTLSVTLHHQVGTCKMGPNTDPEAVVDSQLRVYGTQGLRVADTSVFPTPIVAHTNAPAIMVGEKAADMIISTWDGL